MKSEFRVLAIAFAVTAVSVCLCLYYFHAARVSHTVLVDSTLKPISRLLQEDHALMTELNREPYAESGAGILEAYLLKIRRDGVPRHADMKQLLDQLAENNAAIVTLIEAYSTQAKTTSFTPEGDKFRNYASVWRDRWNSVMEIFMAGGNYAVAGVPFPEGFPAAVEAEIAATR